MIERALNNGIVPGNSESLNRKIRLSNLVAWISLIVIGCYTPFYFYFNQPGGVVMNSSFLVASAINLVLIRKRHYIPAFFMHSSAGFLYFIGGTLLYGIETNLHFYMLIMCMIVSTLFDNRVVIQSYILFAIGTFFALLWWSDHYQPFITIEKEMKQAELLIGNVNLFFLFVIASLFILFFKNDMLRSQYRVTEQKAIIEAKNRDLTESIQYAQRIQLALLPGINPLKQQFPGSFLYYSPKDLVSGDFYWTYFTGKYTFVAVGDCTGHGVPGALMSVMGISLLTEIVENKRILEPAEILGELRNGIIHAFDKEGKSSEYKDGMDLSLVRICEVEKSFTYAAANNPVYHFTQAGLNELKADRQPVGYAHELKPFTQYMVPFQKNDSLVLFTDGYADQFGGPKNKKFMYKSFKLTVEECLDVDRPELQLDHILTNWRGEHEQIDDICIIGIRL
ncbi:MAG TPA: SpoIIE family protein phosphatase [Fluviicola sp.]|nr:SpoIIE family protein phosphatase [Fluviicola sp.]